MDEFVNKKMVVWKEAITPYLEHIMCGWHPMYYIMTIVPLLQNVMSRISWTHNNEDVNILMATIRNMEKTFPTSPTPFSVLLLKMFLFSQGKGQALIDPIKGRTKENILE
jgi:hypothetical protein